MTGQNCTSLHWIPYILDRRQLLLPTKRLFRSAANFDFHDNRPKMADLKSVYRACKWWRHKTYQRVATGKIGSEQRKVPVQKHAGTSLSLGEALYSFVERSERFWQLLHSLVRHISKDIGDRTSAGPFFGRSTISQHAFVCGAIYAGCRLLRCDVALASPYFARSYAPPLAPMMSSARERKKEREREREREETGSCAERFWGGFTKSSWGLGALWDPQRGPGWSPEDFEINAFQRLRTPEHLFPWGSYPSVVIQKSMLFSSYIVIRTTSSVPNHTLWYQKSQCQKLPSFESCSSPAPPGLLEFWILETVPHCDPGPKGAVHSHIHMHSLPVRR